MTNIMMVQMIKNVMINKEIIIHGRKVVNCYVKYDKIKIVFENGTFMEIEVRNK